MKPYSRKFVDDFPSGAASSSAAAVPSSRSSSKDFYNYYRPRPRPLLVLPPTPSRSNGDNDTLNSSSSASPMKPLRPPMSVFDSSMALTVVVLLFVLFFMGFFSVHIHRLSDDSSTNDPQRRRQQTHSRRGSSSGLNPSTIQSLPLFAYDGNAKAKEPLDCPICLSEFEEKESVKLIPFCGHVFHPQCIDMWLSDHCSCPLCRSTRLLPPPPHDRSNDDDPSSSRFVEIEERPGPSRGVHLSLPRRNTDIQSSSPSGVEIECVERRRQQVELPIPLWSGAIVTRANSFSFSSSSIFDEEDRDKLYSISLPRRSSSF